MTYTLISIKDISLVFPHKTCFSGFSCNVLSGARIAVIGNNGSGKSSLLAMMNGDARPSEGSVAIASGVTLCNVPQIVTEHQELSGGERFNKTLSTALGACPDILLLDEPTNHLDNHNRKSLIGMLKRFKGAIIMATHDEDLLRQVVTEIWHLQDGKIHVFKGDYDDYIHEQAVKVRQVRGEISALHRTKKAMHQSLMKEQERAKKSNLRGEKSIRDRKWPTIVSDEKARRAIETSGKKKLAIGEKRIELIEKLGELKEPEVITPTFSLSYRFKGQGAVLSISDGAVGYDCDLIKDISLTVLACEKILIAGDNGSGKTTLIRAICGEKNLRRSGDWFVPSAEDIGYLDQHYGNLGLQSSPSELLRELRPDWQYAQIRNHLNNFLFRKNEEVDVLVRALSGGEKARLSLCLIAANPPSLLILDEVTNNIDLATKRHMITVLRAYPGALVLISHDEGFISELEMDKSFKVTDSRLALY